MLFLLVSYSPLARRQVRASIYPVSRASAWLVVAAPAPPKPTKTQELATRQETAAKRHNLGPVLGLDARSEGKCDGNDCRGFGKKGPRPASSAAMASTRPGAGYGQFLGTAMAAAWFEVLIAFLPAKLRKKMFPTAPVRVEVTSHAVESSYNANHRAGRDGRRGHAHRRVAHFGGHQVRRGPRHRRGEGALPASLFGRRNRLRVLRHPRPCCTHVRRVLMLHTFHLIPPGTIT